MIIAVPAAYALARFRFAGKERGVATLLATQMFPTVASAIPLYLILDALHLLNSRTGLVVCYASTSVPFAIFQLRAAFEAIPVDLEEAAMVDGATRFGAFLRVVLPAARPAIAVTALFAFMSAYNEFILAATLLGREEMFTLPVVLQRYIGEYDQQWERFAAGALVVSLPVMALFYVAQRHLVAGLTSGGVKGSSRPRKPPATDGRNCRPWPSAASRSVCMGGILFNILRHAYDQAAESRRQTEEVIAATGRELASDQHQLEGQLHAWCRAESSGFVLPARQRLAAHSEIDSVQHGRHRSGRAGRHLAAAARLKALTAATVGSKLAGCFSVGVGRHTVSTQLDGSAAPVTLPFLVFPEECFVRRLDRSTRAWVRVGASEEERLRERISTKALLLSDYFQTVARARARAGVARAPSYLQYVTDEVAKLIACIDAREPPARIAGVAGCWRRGSWGCRSRRPTGSPG